MDDKKPWHAVEIEALEEAVAAGFISDLLTGAKCCVKRLDRCITAQCRITIYPMAIERLKRRGKERNECKRH